MRPKSIVHFEYVYWAIILLGLAGVAIGWSYTMSSVQIQASVAQLGMAIVYLPLVLGLLIQLALLYFIARRGSVIAKWIFTVLSGASVAWSVFTLATRDAITPVAGVIDVALAVLQVIAIMLLFRADTRAWFGEEPAAV